MKGNGIIKQLIWTERYEREMKLDCNAEIKQSFNEEWKKWNNDKDCQHPKSYSFQTATTLNIKQMNLIQNVSKVIIHSWITIITRSTKDFNLDINRFNIIAKCDFITNTANLEHAANQKHTRQIELQIMVHSWIWFIKLKLNGNSGELVASNLMKRNGINEQHFSTYTEMDVLW